MKVEFSKLTKKKKKEKTKMACFLTWQKEEGEKFSNKILKRKRKKIKERKLEAEKSRPQATEVGSKALKIHATGRSV